MTHTLSCTIYAALHSLYLVMQSTNTFLLFLEYFFSFFTALPSALLSHKKACCVFLSHVLLSFILLIIPLSSSLPMIHSTLPLFYLSHSLPSQFPSTHENKQQFPLLMYSSYLPHCLASGHALQLHNKIFPAERFGLKHLSQNCQKKKKKESKTAQAITGLNGIRELTQQQNDSVCPSVYPSPCVNYFSSCYLFYN